MTHCWVVDSDGAVLEAQVADGEVIQIVRRGGRRAHGLPHAVLAAALVHREPRRRGGPTLRQAGTRTCGRRRAARGVTEESVAQPNTLGARSQDASINVSFTQLHNRDCVSVTPLLPAWTTPLHVSTASLEFFGHGKT